MRIQSSQVALSSAHSYFEQSTREESLEFWVGDRRPPAEAEARSRPAPPAAPPAHANASANASTKTSALEDDDDKTLDPVSLMLKKLIEQIFGVRIQITPKFDAAPSNNCDFCLPTATASSGSGEDGVQRQGWGLDYQLRETYTESEQLAFAAKGVVRTTDGRDIQFDLALKMQREFTESSEFRLRAGDALIDPLVLNFNGTAAQLTSQRYAFDLNADGKTEEIPFVKAGSAFLVLDKNGDGKVNDGSELFGPKTGQGFAELAQYDSDHNSWIDENDPIYNRLQLWSLDESGKPKLNSLAEKNVGAIYLGNASTPFTLKNEAQETQGQIAASGVFLKESGGAGLVQQVNLVA